jgi:hypothetical protein
MGVELKKFLAWEDAVFTQTMPSLTACIWRGRDLEQDTAQGHEGLDHPALIFFLRRAPFMRDNGIDLPIKS